MMLRENKLGFTDFIELFLLSLTRIKTWFYLNTVCLVRDYISRSKFHND